jgi:hypothetical protein
MGPGLILAGAVGGSAAVAAACVVRKPPLGMRTSMLRGVQSRTGNNKGELAGDTGMSHSILTHIDVECIDHRQCLTRSMAHERAHVADSADPSSCPRRHVILGAEE